jgi:hypothetical protein
VQKILVIVLAVVLALSLSFTSVIFAAEGKNEVIPAQMVLDASLSEVSTVFDTPKANLEVAASRAFSFGDDTFLLSSIVDKNSKQAYMVSTDAQGKVWIAEPKIEGELIDYMSQMKPEETVTVNIWAIYVSPEEELGQIPSKYPDVPFEGYRPALGANVSHEVLEAIEADVTEIKLRANEEAVQPVVDFLQSTENTILYVSKYAPTVDAQLSKEDVCKLARLPEVSRISLPDEIEPFMDTAAYTIQAQYLWWEGYNGGMSDGSGSPTNYQTSVAVIDDGIDFDHWSLEHANGGIRPDTMIRGGHGTAVAGCIASNYPTYRGIAPGTELLDANCANAQDKPVDWKTACDWAHDQNVDLYNFSAGVRGGGWNNDLCEYFDHIASYWDRLPVCAAGNIPNCGEYVASPAKAWNVLAVGGVDDNDTGSYVGTVSWADDTLYEDSSWRNPETPHGDREKPEVCAPAVDITTTLLEDDFITVSGTSFAAPQVAGLAALLIEANPTLYDKPALIKAIIMASAIHNVEPDDDYEQWGYGSAPVEQYRPMDDKEGVGTVDAYAAYECVTNEDHPSTSGGWTWWGSKVEANLPFVIPFYARAGETVRFVISWYAHTTYGGWTDYELCADMNLEIIGGMCYPWWPTWYGGSNSHDSAWEIVRFTAPYTGNYYARVSAYDRGAGDPWTYNGPEYIAAAWYRS